MSVANPNSANTLRFQEESIRLAEIRAQGLAESIQRIEKKAVLFATACVVLLGFLFQYGARVNESIGGDMRNLLQYTHLVAFFVLFLCVVFCLRILHRTQLEVVGLSPTVSEYFERTFANDMQLMARNKRLLSDYNRKINFLLGDQRARMKNLKWARMLLFVGLLYTFLYIVTPLIYALAGS